MKRATSHLPALILFLSVSLLVRTTVGVGVVSGFSMHPTLAPGDLVVFVRHMKPVEGTIVVANLPEHGLIVKRMAAAGGRPGAPPALEHGYCFLLGDNLEYSYDSRAFGPVAARHILGRVVVIWPDRGQPARPYPHIPQRRVYSD